MYFRKNVKSKTTQAFTTKDEVINPENKWSVFPLFFCLWRAWCCINGIQFIFLLIDLKDWKAYSIFKQNRYTWVIWVLFLNFIKLEEGCSHWFIRKSAVCQWKGGGFWTLAACSCHTESTNGHQLGCSYSSFATSALHSTSCCGNAAEGPPVQI